ncbi:MAG: hypothetical protein A3C11_00115 [Candidatus Sungbacteria bacterium RIFCSPHIGHO2_02_FULL_49_12]|uniref:Uncharacterized protein n=1 Tax=Candidatus Sungbacteria bacterium RIFCSPHIGHO2_02_FULL_49_12 TaxID=1802271 RepID=A0A1G2KTN5_9BACT|nr:MAG: hypothetical protein A3C11_00115 [Candidatus Sungbacteria bacterium RIFCSPHIGHO2_02_FULL_49_12]
MKIPKLFKKFRTLRLTFEVVAKLGVWVLGISFFLVMVSAGLVYYWYPGAAPADFKGESVTKQFAESDFQALVQLLEEREIIFASSSTPIAVPPAFR